MHNLDADFLAVANTLLDVHDKHSAIISAAIDGKNVDKDACETACRETIALAERILDGGQITPAEDLADCKDLTQMAMFATIRFHAALTKLKICGPPFLEKEIDESMGVKK
jgi:hypothetical protein